MNNYFTILFLIVAGMIMTTSCEKELQDPQRYTITVTDNGNGTGTASPAEADEGATIELTATPIDGYTFSRWTITEGNAELEDVSANPATFTMPAENIAIKAEFSEEVSQENVVYHEGIGSWIAPQNDPYALDNVQRAYDNLSLRGLTRTEDLEPTHYALKIFPKDEDEQWKIELMEDVKISYIPFSYVALTEEEIQKIGTPSTSVIFKEVSPYIVTNDYMRTIEGEVEESVSFTMPVLYAAWPVGKPLPDDMDYRIDYDVLIPSALAKTRNGSIIGEDILQELEDEAIRLALGYCTPRLGGAKTKANVVLSGEFWIWEVLRTIKGPVPRVKVKFHLGSNIIETDADENGYFSISTSSIPSNASWDIMFQNSKWKVTREGSTIPKSFFQGTIYQTAFWSNTNTHVSIAVQPLEATIIKALDYFYYRTHAFTKWEVAGGIHVIANSNSNSSYNGMFSYSSSNSYYITVFRNNTTNRNILAGTIFHELGHFIHFRERGGTYDNMTDTNRFLQESFASYSGWYFVEKYYAELGYVKTPGQDISGQGRQTWLSTTAGSWGDYSPLFVDLVDNFNQSQYYGGTYNNDEIKGDASHAAIMKIAKESTDWESCKDILRKSEIFTGQDLDTFLVPYDYWFTH